MDATAFAQACWRAAHAAEGLAAQRPNAVYGHFIPGRSDLQRFVFEDGSEARRRPGGDGRARAVGRLYLSSVQPGSTGAGAGSDEEAGGQAAEGKLLWSTAPEEACDAPLCVVLRGRGDAHDDIAVATWYRVMVYDGATGAKKHELRWHGGRSYGTFEVVRTHPACDPWLVVLADFVPHLDVLRWRGGRLDLVWRKVIEGALLGQRRVLRVPAQPVVDLLGDGRRQLALNLYDGGCWHAQVLDLATGAPLLDRKDCYIQGVAEGRTSRRHILLTCATRGLLLRTDGPPGVIRAAAGHLGWSAAAAPGRLRGRWLTRTAVGRPAYQASIATLHEQVPVLTDLDRDGATEGWLVTGTPARGLRWVAVGLETEALRPAPRRRATRSAAQCVFAPGVQAEVVAVRESALVVRVLGQPGSWLVRPDGLRVAGVIHGRKDLAADVPVAISPATGQGVVAVADGAGQVMLVEPGPAQPALWRVPGRAQTVDGQVYLGLEARLTSPGPGGVSRFSPDLLARRSRGGRAASCGPVGSVLAATLEDDGSAALTAYSTQGRPRGRYRFAAVPGEDPQWNQGGLMLWTTLPGEQPAPVLACLRRAAMHSEETVLLAADLRQERWRQTSLERRGCGGAPLAMCPDPPGPDAILGAFPDILFRLRGRTGLPTRVQEFPHAVLGGWSGYATPLVADLLGKGTPQVLLGRCIYTLALLDAEGHLLWHTPYLQGTSTCASIANLAGRLDVVAGAYGGGLRCYDGRSGVTRWTWGCEAVSDPAVADIDGDGRDEVIVAQGHHLVAVAERAGLPHVLWSLDLRARVHAPALADVDGDGLLEVLCTRADGMLCCIGTARAPSDPPTLP